MTNTTMRRLLSGAALAAIAAGGAQAQDVTLRLHQFLPLQANVPSAILQVWIDQVQEASGGRIEIEHYPSMQLGGAPPELYDQAVSGIADIVWTVNGYTPGRFPSTEVFELPFMMEDARVMSCAYWTMFEEGINEEFSDTVILGTWVHGQGMLHTADPVELPDDLQGMQIRGGSRTVNELLELAGATPVGMPVPAIPESLSRGVIDGTTIPWEVTTALRVAELVENHTEFDGPALYTLTFVLAMNADAFNAMPEDLQAIMMENSGLEFSIFAGGTMADLDAPARALAEEAGNNIVTVDAATAEAEWLPLVAPIYDSWVADMAERGIDGEGLITRARELMAGDCAGAAG